MRVTWILPAVLLGVPFLGWLLKGRPPLREFLAEGGRERTEADRREEAQIEDIEGLPADVEIEAYATSFTPPPEVRPSVRAALVRTLSRRPRLRDDMVTMLAHPRVDWAWKSLTVLADLDPAVARGLDGPANDTIRRLAAAIREAPHTKLQHFYHWQEAVEPTLVAARTLTAHGVDCREGIRKLVAAAELYPASRLRDPFLRDARAWLAAEGTR